MYKTVQYILQYKMITLVFFTALSCLTSNMAESQLEPHSLIAKREFKPGFRNACPLFILQEVMPNLQF